MELMVFLVFFILVFVVDTTKAFGNSSCGIDSSSATAVYEGIAEVETYPWMGFLYYTAGRTRYTATVVLVTKQIVLAGATEIDRLPKNNFRAVTKVVLGHKCGENEIRVRDYTFHPEYATNTYAALAMIQLETDHVKQDLRPICPPPTHLAMPEVYAMTLVGGCKNPKIRIHRMQYLSIESCKDFYRKAGKTLHEENVAVINITDIGNTKGQLDLKSFWPTHTACAQAIHPRKCIWQSGSVLTIKQDGRWRLLGFSIHGPGCGDPSRFLDYGKYHRWVRATSVSVGRPAISRLGDNHLVMRRSMSNLQRFGSCDAEEARILLYSDKVTILYEPGKFHGSYNVTLVAGVDYSCVVFFARTLDANDYKMLDLEPPETIGFSDAATSIPKITLRRWCSSPTAMCYGFQFIDIKFSVDIVFSNSIEFSMLAFGQKAKIINPRAATKFMNKGRHPYIHHYKTVVLVLKLWKSHQKHQWFYND